MGLTRLPCPICKKTVTADDPNMPFCSDRCRVIDLGNWASEKYVISKPNHASEFEASEFEETEDPLVDEGPIH